MSLQAWDTFKSTAEISRPLSSGRKKQFRRVSKWLQNFLARSDLARFTIQDFKSALKGLNKNSVGLDRVPASFFPSDDQHLQLLVDAINRSIYSHHPLHPNLKRSKSCFIEKPGSAKLRGLSIGNRLAGVIERMMADRLMVVVTKSEKLRDRYGFIKNRNIDSIYAKLVDKIWTDRRNQDKSAIVSFDQSKAYDTVSHQILLIKLKKLIQQHGEIKKFGILINFTYLWLQNRVTYFGKFKARIKQGVPQGSPYSCLLYVVFFDFQSSGTALALLFADDNNYVLSAKSWCLLEDLITRLHGEFASWCNINGQRINLAKSTIIFIRRKTAVPESFSLKESVTNFTKCLGVYLDSNFDFGQHVSYLIRWLKTRTIVIKRLQRLGVSCDVLLRVAQCYRSKCLFGSWWTTCLAKTNLDSLNAAFGRTIRACVGFSKLVPFEVAADFTGVDQVKEYLPYWLASRSVVDFMRGSFDLLAEFLGEFVPRSKSNHNLRASTVLASDECHRTANSRFPATAVSLFELSRPLREFGLLAFRRCLLGFKMMTKKKFLRRLIAKGTPIAEAVREVNEKYYNLRVG